MFLGKLVSREAAFFVVRSPKGAALGESLCGGISHRLRLLGVGLDHLHALFRISRAQGELCAPCVRFCGGHIGK